MWASLVMAAARRRMAELGLGLEQALLVQQIARVDEAARRAGAPALAPAQVGHRGQHPAVELLVGPELDPDLVGAVEQLGQLAGQVADGVRGVGAELRAGALDAGASAVPDLALAIARAHQQGERRRATGRQHQHGVGLGEAGQVDHVGRGAIAIVHVGVARDLATAGQQQHRARRQRRQHPGAPLGVHARAHARAHERAPLRAPAARSASTASAHSMPEAHASSVPTPRAPAPSPAT